ncbi:hydrogenase nickel incorporation protein HypB [Mycolicibacterium goodii]|uniref:Hydrogenase nickel incorporation protein HypB n=1 Tax=Mycolicibacterium goodii TaxID=134601 RepID=A0ABS6HMC2_MYCGD|nr:hydrogenase nickel incorporation protein HypB [Mycolicibacterium goodii]MBU8813082.1 hydrogenase nickel incorporation protein HypB [Mycolicibacterium goodii]MBU8822367.1 hydrogenase nickel incorporation protein HypB [Mycolicibacterium goodii]MBU8832303.1 hydrogenase nickel incorporation protein HypB [Mycolicibacterium goodii]MBU8835360.1 hydrogenase nickel incorporation protein HypB [Mycolicibacterium goodii]PJK19095.1 hydrogenase accessory protein HypB [Mycolicibacterium goodii]
MCATCGCGGDDGTDGTSGAVITGQQSHRHEHQHQHQHQHEHTGPTETVTLEQRVLAKNDRLAEQNRDRLTARGVLALNITSSPGAGKTTLLERTIRDLGKTHPIAVIEGDQETLLDADRIRAAGACAVQINTGAGCHLDAAMVRRALDTLDPAPGSLLFIENVGNLVCPALFDLGENHKVVVISVTEGTDKPLKYPHMFAAADLVILNKIDLLPYVDFDIDTCCGYAQSVNPGIMILQTSATRGDGLAGWYDWLGARLDQGVPQKPRRSIDKTTRLE